MRIDRRTAYLFGDYGATIWHFGGATGVDERDFVWVVRFWWDPDGPQCRTTALINLVYFGFPPYD